MDTFFKPVHSPSGPGEIKPRRHHHHHHLPHHHDPQSHRYANIDDTDRNTDESHGHHYHHQHGRYLHDNPPHNSHHHHPNRQFQHSEVDEILYNNETPVTLSRASSSSLSSSSSSSSFSSWYTEENAYDPFSLGHPEQPQHSLSCSNISEVRRGFREDDGSEPIVFATIKHRNNGSVCSETHGSAQKRVKRGFPCLDRGHSRSEEGLLQGNESDLEGEQSRVPHNNYGPLHKAVSLSRSLAVNEEEFLLGVSRGPKRAVSSSQLPSKGILKNKEPHSDIRKAKSMEVLSPRVTKQPIGQKGKKKVVQARSTFVQEKLQFSAFLDEITKQVISPSALNILGVNKDKATVKTHAPPPQSPGPVKPQLPPKKHRGSLGEVREQKQHNNRPEKAPRSSSRKHSDCSNPEQLISYGDRDHHGSPPPHPYPRSPSQNSHHESSRKERRPSSTGGSVSGDRYGRCGPQLTDGTSTSPESIQPKHHQHRKQQSTTSHGQSTQQYPQHQPHPGLGHRGLVSQGVGPAHGSESSSSKSDSPRGRDTASTATSYSSELSGRHQPQQHVGPPLPRRDTLCDAGHLQALQEENSDLHQNLVQTVVCIESLEAELQRTRDELGHVKEKYKSLLDTHTGTKQANNLLGEHLHIASESLTSERKYLQTQVSQLSSELEDAHRTIAGLENINVPCLIKDLLEKHFGSADAIQKLLATSAPISQPALQAGCQSHTPKVEEAVNDWLTKSEAAPKRVTAFIPFKQGGATTGTESSVSAQHESRHSPPFSVADISTAIYKKMAASYAARPQPQYPNSQQQLALGTNHTDTPPNLQPAHVGGDSWAAKEREGTRLEQDVVDVTAVSAQQILDDFLQQLQPHKEAGGGEQRGKGAE
ncbi:hypothetical protein CgunFtcFv8_017545 [Champsocephalus gunnari]|uniref:Uncharacterized protein n=1 Tax=Champsocephalus gunnari TaxID=52237 RepID=A0AAN8DMY9_CHAGU|nr:hypothetical protein CgunFtcFv8_017545 [Champsocephalus gunnari]